MLCNIYVLLASPDVHVVVARQLYKTTYYKDKNVLTFNKAIEMFVYNNNTNANLHCDTLSLSL